MTKSFTASAILLLRDEGRLRLDDPVADHVPALAAWSPPTRDSGPITIRQLLTMTAGLPTDDPWGDRQQALPLDAFDALLRAGPVFAWPPGTAFDYSNLGYGILGRVITAVGRRGVPRRRPERLMAPLGMTSSGFDEDEIPAERLAHGYARAARTSCARAEDVYGALASMGGVYSTVRGPRPVGRRVPRRVPGPRRPGGRPSAPPVVAPRDAAVPPVRRGGRGPPRPRGARRSRRGGYGYGLWASVATGRRDHRRTRRRVPGLRDAHGLAPGDGPRRHRRRQPPLRGRPSRRGRAARGAGGGGWRRRAPAAPDCRGSPRPPSVVERLLERLGRRGGRRVVRDEHGPRRAARARAARPWRRPWRGSAARSALDDGSPARVRLGRRTGAGGCAASAAGSDARSASARSRCR